MIDLGDFLKGLALGFVIGLTFAGFGIGLIAGYAL